MQKPEKWLKPWHVGTHLGVLIENYPINTNMTGFRWFSKIVHPCALEESSHSIERVNQLFKELHFYDYLGIQVWVYIIQNNTGYVSKGSNKMIY